MFDVLSAVPTSYVTAEVLQGAGSHTFHSVALLAVPESVFPVPLIVGYVVHMHVLVTNAVVAIFVELSPAAGVGAVGVPVNAADASGA